MANSLGRFGACADCCENTICCEGRPFAYGVSIYGLNFKDPYDTTSIAAQTGVQFNGTGAIPLFYESEDFCWYRRSFRGRHNGCYFYFDLSLIISDGQAVVTISPHGPYAYDDTYREWCGFWRFAGSMVDCSATTTIRYSTGGTASLYTAWLWQFSTTEEERLAFTEHAFCGLWRYDDYPYPPEADIAVLSETCAGGTNIDPKKTCCTNNPLCDGDEDYNLDQRLFDPTSNWEITLRPLTSYESAEAARTVLQSSGVPDDTIGYMRIPEKVYVSISGLSNCTYSDDTTWENAASLNKTIVFSYVGRNFGVIHNDRIYPEAQGGKFRGIYEYTNNGGSRLYLICTTWTHVRIIGPFGGVAQSRFRVENSDGTVTELLIDHVACEPKPVAGGTWSFPIAGGEWVDSSHECNPPYLMTREGACPQDGTITIMTDCETAPLPVEPPEGGYQNCGCCETMANPPGVLVLTLGGFLDGGGEGCDYCTSLNGRSVEVALTDYGLTSTSCWYHGTMPVNLDCDRFWTPGEITVLHFWVQLVCDGDEIGGNVSFFSGDGTDPYDDDGRFLGWLAGNGTAECPILENCWEEDAELCYDPEEDPELTTNPKFVAWNTLQLPYGAANGCLGDLTGTINFPCVGCPSWATEDEEFA